MTNGLKTIMNSPTVALMGTVYAIGFATLGAFAFFRTDDYFRFLDRWGLLGVDPNSEFWQTSTRGNGAFFMAFSVLLYFMFMIDCGRQVLGQTF